MRKSTYLAGSSLAAALLISGTAFAGTAPALAQFSVEPQGTVSLRELAASPANLAALAAHRGPIEMLTHRLPGFARRAPVSLPAIPANVAVGSDLATIKATGFTGITGGSQLAAIGGELEPPDQGLAVNNGTVVEIVNNSIQVFDSTGKALDQPVANATFFNSGSANLSDPHAVFDPTTQRWFIEELVFSNTFTGFEVAVSQTSDPLGKYYLYKVSAETSKIAGCGSALCLPDYPQVGFDANGFYITADLFSNSSGQFVNAALYALPKATLEAGAKLKTYPYFVVPEFVLQPAIPAPGEPFVGNQNGTEYLMTARNIFDGTSNVRVYALTNTANIVSNPSSLATSFVDVAAETYTGTVAQTQPDVVGPYGKSVGATNAPPVDAGYNAFGGGVKYAKGKLFGALASGATDSKGLARDVIAWFSVKPTVRASGVKATIAAQGYITPGAGYSLSYPDFALAKNGRGIVGFSIMNKSQAVKGGFPSTAYVNFTGTATGTALKVVGQGNTSDDGFTGYQNGVGRWGDYGGGTVDAVTGSYYVANEFIPDATKYPRGTYTNWGTFVTKYK